MSHYLFMANGLAAVPPRSASGGRSSCRELFLGVHAGQRLRQDRARFKQSLAEPKIDLKKPLLEFGQAVDLQTCLLKLGSRSVLAAG